MTYNDPSSSSTVTPKSKSFVERLIGVFTSPSATMQDIAARPSWLIPLILVCVSALAFSLYTQDLIIETQRTETLKRNPNMTEEQIAGMEKVMKITTPIFAVLGTGVFYLAIGGLLLFTGNILLGGQTKFKTLFSTVCWSGVITLVSSLINAPVMKARGVMESATSLAGLLPSGDSKSVLHTLLSQIDLLNIWWVAVAGFGFAAAYKFSTKKSMITVFVWWAIFVAIGVAVKTMTS
ncbi:hypothetical protein DCC62_19855 [candidate division KSB1 bacterium]|nr:YIP1 family protein [candidate division KSB1 bacterium]RIK72351.1 MAG: hypothetical protein DCC62_19855 [candidate division KSB1 bacterium]